MASAKNFNTADSKLPLLLVQNEKGEYRGYRQELLSRFLNELEFELYICTKCNGIMRNACQIGDDQILVCEVCVKKEEKSQPMGTSRKKIPKLSVKCPLESRGCEWEGDIENIDAHIDVCKEFIVECWNMCGVILKRSEMTDHCEEVCLNRTVKCTHCKEEMLYMEIETHFTVCPEFPLLCLNECIKSIIRKEMDSHIENDCPNTIVLCANGCGSKFKRSKLLIHCEKNCQHRKVNCTHCKVVLQYKEIDSHLTTCPELPLLCPNECMKTFPRKEMNSHIEKDCPNTLVHCMNGCGLKMKRRILSTHCEYECQHRKVSCEYCRTTLKYKELENHYKHCLEFPLFCPNECQRRLIRKEIWEHVKTDCPNTIVVCPYKEMGCEMKIKRCEVREHQEMFNSKHLDMTVLYYSEREKKFTSQLKDKDEEISCLTDQLEAKGLEMEKVKGDNETLSDTLFSMEMKMFDNQQENERLIDVIRFYENENKEASILKLEYGTEPKLSDLLSEMKRDEPKPKPEPKAKEKKKSITERELEIFTESLKTGFLNRYTSGIVSSGWKRKLVTLEDETLHFYNTTQEFSLPMSRLKGVSTHVDDENPRKPGMPPNSSVENGFVVTIAGGTHYFVADTREEAKEWMELLREISKKNYKAKSVKRASVKQRPSESSF